MGRETLKNLLEEAADSEGCISWQAYEKIAGEFSLSFREIESEILENGFFPLRYQRQREILGNEKQLRLLNSRVAIVGCGGLGGTIFDMLLRLGVGRLLLLDPDFLVESNLNRQLLATFADLGRSKVEVAVEYGRRVNPVVEVEALAERFQSRAGMERLGLCDLVFDALDSVSARLELARACTENDLFLIHGAVAGWSGQMVPVSPASERMRKIYPGYFCDREDLCDCGKSGAADVGAFSGNLAPTVNAIAAFQVSAALKYICSDDSGGDLPGCFIDLSSFEMEKIVCAESTE